MQVETTFLINIKRGGYMKDNIKIIISTIIGTVIAFYVGAMFNFFPFIGKDLIMREIGFCTLIICTVIAICSCVILNAIKKDNSDNCNHEKNDKHIE